jgi:hypothetical protein
VFVAKEFQSSRFECTPALEELLVAIGIPYRTQECGFKPGFWQLETIRALLLSYYQNMTTCLVSTSKLSKEIPEILHAEGSV